MFKFKQFYTLNEGGAGGHMFHPFDLPEIKTGENLIGLFEKTANYLSGPGVTAPLKIDGVNASVRLINVGGKKQFALYRNTIADVEEPTTIDNIETRFVPGHGLIGTYKTVLSIFNAGLKDTLPELQELGLVDNPLIIFNTEYVTGKTNVVGYSNNFLAIHYPAVITNKVGKDGKQLKSFETKKIPFSEEVLQRYTDKLDVIAKKFSFNAVHQIPAKLTKRPNLRAELSTEVTINNVTKSLDQWSKGLVIPKGQSVKTVDGKIVSATAKEAIYNRVMLDGVPLNQIIAPEGLPLAVNGIVTWHICRLLGKAILDNMDSKIGPASSQEGIVIDNPKVGSEQFKITGEFIVGGRASAFKKDPSKASQKLVVIYPGRFQPFHKAHAQVFNTLKKLFSKADVYIATSDKVELPKSPFNFNEKLQMIEASGIDPSNVVKSANPYLAKEILAKYDPVNTVVIFAVGQKDMEGDEARFKFGLTKKGTPSYYQPLKNMAETETMDKHGYIMVAPTATFNVLGKPAMSASEIRNMWKTATPQQKKKITADLYGQPLQNIIDLFNSKLT